MSFPASIWALSSKPWATSLTDPSPPTQTTLLQNKNAKQFKINSSTGEWTSERQLSRTTCIMTLRTAKPILSLRTSQGFTVTAVNVNSQDRSILISAVFYLSSSKCIWQLTKCSLPYHALCTRTVETGELSTRGTWVPQWEFFQSFSADPHKHSNAF